MNMLNVDFSKIEKGQTIAVALSGGIDSVCLLHCLLENKEKLNINVVAINVEHGIRGENSLKDSAFCRELCKSLNVPLFSYTVDSVSFSKQNGLSIEEAARLLRYDCFFDCIEKGVCDKVAVAHHLSDNAETILFNIFRGAALSGAKGISDISYNDKIIRPFLSVSKEEIRLYADKHAISYVTDETNDSTVYTRNYIRLNVMPQIKKLFPNVEASLSRFAQSCKGDDDYLYELASRQLKICELSISIPCNLAYPVFSRAVILALKRFSITKDYTKANIDDVWALTTNQTGKMVNLPQNVYAVREHDNVVIRKAENTDFSPIPFAYGDLKAAGSLITTTIIDSSGVKFGDGLYFDKDKLPADVIIRRKEDGDIFTKFNGQTVSLKKFLTDKKLSAYQKRNLLVIAKESQVYIVIGLEISRLIMIDNKTTNIVKLTCTKDKE